MAQCFARLHLGFLVQLPGSLLKIVSKCRYNVWPLAHPVRIDLANGALFWVCSCANGPGAPGAHLLVQERMVAKKPAPQHTILVCAMSSTPGQATSRGARGPGGG